MNKDLKVIFMGTPAFSVPVLEGLIENYNVIAVVTQPDKPVGRGGKISVSPIKQVAIDHNIEVYQPTKIREQYQEIIALNPDIIITCAYGQIIPKVLLDCPKYGCINVHASLLPKLRGGAPIHHAIIDGYDKTGITIMYMDVNMDTGDIISMKDIIIEDNDTMSMLHDKLKILGRDLLLETLPNIISGNINPIKQNNDEATYAYNIKKEEEKIDFNNKKRDIYNLIRGLNSFPGAYAIMDNKRMKIWNSYITDKVYPNALIGEITNIYKDGIGIKVQDGEIVITDIQLEGKKRMLASDYLNGIDKKQLIGKVLQ
ncbi:MAG: methionyl-tRNA formyltransferase [Bacilli bacterium]|nr:methionyl-tRNA formyltransferase [Bacilli bacterium]